jgi:hypothetical protein
VEFRGNLLTTNKNTKKKLEVLKSITKDALIEGVSSIKDIDDKLNNIEDYSPSLFFPLGELNRPLLFFKELQDALTEARSSEGLASEYISALVNLQEELYSGVRSLVHDWFSVQQRLHCLTTYEKYLHRSVGATLSLVPVSFFISPERSLDSVFGNCHVTLNNQLVLPIEKQSIFPIRRVDFEGYSEEKDTDLNQHVQMGPFMFRATTNIAKEQVRITVELEQEEQVNHLRIPCSLPLPAYIDNIQLLDSADRQTRLFTRLDLDPLIRRVPVALELVFPPTPVKRIKVTFRENLDTQKLGLTTQINLTEIEANLAPVLAKNIEILNARGQIDRHEMEPLLHDMFASFRTLLTDQSLNSVDAWCSVFGVVLEASLTDFARSGDFSTRVYCGKDVRMSAVRGEGVVMDHLGQTHDINGYTDIPSTFLTFKLVKSCLDVDENLLSRVFVTHPLSRPFTNRVTELLTAQDTQDRRSEAIVGQQIYGLNMYSSDTSTLDLYIPTLDGPQVASGNVSVNSQARVTTVTVNNLLLEDVIAQYSVEAPASPNLGNFSEQRPYYISPLGSIMYRKPEDNVDTCDMHLVLEMHRANFSKHLTPIVDSMSVILGHRANKRSNV